MSIVRRLARPLLATGYVAGGVEAFRNSSAAAEKLDPVLKQVEQVLPQVRPVTANRAQVAQGIAAAQVLAASALALSKLPRLSASVLLGTTAINTYVQYQSADTSTKEAKSNRRNNVFKNLSLVGAVMIASVDTSGNPSSRGAPATSRTMFVRTPPRSPRTPRRSSPRPRRPSRTPSATKGSTTL